MDAENNDYRVISLATSENDKNIPVDSKNESVFPGNISNIGWKDIISGNINEITKGTLNDAYRKYANNLVRLIKKRTERIVRKLED